MQKRGKGVGLRAWKLKGPVGGDRQGDLTDGEPTIRRREKWVDFGQVAIGMVISKQCKVNRQREREGILRHEKPSFSSVRVSRSSV